MSFSKVQSIQATSLETTIVSVETDISNGLNSFSIVGLPTKAVEEARDRISAAIKNSGFRSPKQKNQKVVVSLAPASIKKEGTSFDLSIALGYLKASGEICFEEEDSIFIGELSLNGKLCPIKGVLPMTWAAAEAGFKKIFVPEANALEAAFVRKIEVYGAGTLFEVITHINQKEDTEFNPPKSIAVQPITPLRYKKTAHKNTFSHVRGQETAKRALEIAAAGRHNIAMHGPPGAGKTLLARALSSILPSLNEEQVFETTSLHSVAGTLPPETLITEPPFRSPHHTSSPVAVVGGGNIPKPGEITLSHNGVLFMDEFPEFDRRIIEALREPMEEGRIAISRSQGKVSFPANFLMVAAFNPCPCGYFGSEKGECVCTAHDINRYRKKLSGPIIDRIDLWCDVEAVAHKKLSTRQKENRNLDKVMILRINKAREIQKERFSDQEGCHTNKDMNSQNIDRKARLSEGAENTLLLSAEKMGLSARTYHKVIKVARTIADLEESEWIEDVHILEALRYRPSTNMLL